MASTARSSSDPMAHADDHQPHGATCGARTRSDGVCGHPPMRGQRRCRYHGGASPQALRAAERRMERDRVSAAITRLGVAVPEGADPLEVLSRALSVAAGDLEAMRVQVSTVEPDDASNATVRLYAEALDRAGRLAKIAADTNLAERQAAISEANIRVVADAVRRAMDAVPLDPSSRQALVNAVSRELRAVGGA